MNHAVVADDIFKLNYGNYLNTRNNGACRIMREILKKVSSDEPIQS
jgi:hypothetical protein